MNKNSWQNKPNVTLAILIDNENYWFNTLFSKVQSWNDDDQKYALTELFAVYHKSLSKKMQDKVKEMKKKFKL